MSPISDRTGSRRSRVWALFAGGVATVLLAVAAIARHPQGNVGRVVPYVVAACVVWVVVVAAVVGRRAAMLTACALAAAGLLAVAAYVFFIEPIDFAECGTLVEELGQRECRSHASVWLAAGAAGGSIVMVAAMVSVARASARP